MSEGVEIRNGIRFSGKVTGVSRKTSYSYFKVTLYIEGMPNPIGRQRICFCNYEQAVGIALDFWLREGLFEDTVTDSALLEILREAKGKTSTFPGDKRCWRFLRDKRRLSGKRFLYILTDDKSDLLNSK